MTFKKLSSGYYESDDETFRILRVDTPYGVEWRLLQQEQPNSSHYEWCQTFDLLRDAKAAANRIAENLRLNAPHIHSNPKRPTIDELKAKAKADAASAPLRFHHYRGYKAIKARLGYAGYYCESNGSTLTVTCSIYEDGRHRSAFSVGFKNLNQKQAEHFINTGELELS